MSELLSILVPVAPAPECNPNWAGDPKPKDPIARLLRQSNGSTVPRWKRKADAVKELRHATWAAAVGVKPSDPIWYPVTAHALIKWPSHRGGMDDTNAAASLKWLWDGLTYAKIWRDDKLLKSPSIEQVKMTAEEAADFPAGMVIVTVRRLPND
jgi:hypothetical protein